MEGKEVAKAILDRGRFIGTRKRGRENRRLIVEDRKSLKKKKK